MALFKPKLFNMIDCEYGLFTSHFLGWIFIDKVASVINNEGASLASVL